MVDQIVSTHKYTIEQYDEITKIHTDTVKLFIYLWNGKIARIDARYRWIQQSTKSTFRPLQRVIGFDWVRVRIGPDRKTIAHMPRENLVAFVKKQKGKVVFQSLSNLLAETCKGQGQDSSPVVDKFLGLFTDFFIEHLK
jgi:hypothetical protein